MYNNEKVIDALNKLLGRTYDAEQGYIEAANHVNSVNLRYWFQENSAQRYRFGHELKSEIKRLGGTPSKGTTALGELHQAWMDLKSYFVSKDEVAMLNESIRGEETAVDNYKEILSDTTLPIQTKTLLESQLSTISGNVNTMKTMVNSYEAVS